MKEISGFVCTCCSSIWLGSEVRLTGFSVVLVEQSGKAWYRAVVVPGRVTGVLQVGIGVAHFGSVGRVGGNMDLCWLDKVHCKTNLREWFCLLVSSLSCFRLSRADS